MSWDDAWQAYRAQPSTGVTVEAVEQDAFTAGWEAAQAQQPYPYFLGPKPPANPQQWQAYLEYAREQRRAGSTVLPFMSWLDEQGKEPTVAERSSHWAVVRADNIVFAQGECWCDGSGEHTIGVRPKPIDAGADHG